MQKPILFSLMCASLALSLGCTEGQLTGSESADSQKMSKNQIGVASDGLPIFDANGAVPEIVAAETSIDLQIERKAKFFTQASGPAIIRHSGSVTLARAGYATANFSVDQTSASIVGIGVQYKYNSSLSLNSVDCRTVAAAATAAITHSLKFRVQIQGDTEIEGNSATSEGSDECTPYQSTVSVTPSTIGVGRSAQAFISSDPCTSVYRTWTSTNPAVASVDPATGVVEGNSTGNAEITVTCAVQSGSSTINYGAVTVVPAQSSGGGPGAPPFEEPGEDCRWVIDGYIVGNWWDGYFIATSGWYRRCDFETLRLPSIQSSASARKLDVRLIGVTSLRSGQSFEVTRNESLGTGTTIAVNLSKIDASDLELALRLAEDVDVVSSKRPQGVSLTRVATWGSTPSSRVSHQTPRALSALKALLRAQQDNDPQYGRGRVVALTLDPHGAISLGN